MRGWCEQATSLASVAICEDAERPIPPRSCSLLVAASSTDVSRTRLAGPEMVEAIPQRGVFRVHQVRVRRQQRLRREPRLFERARVTERRDAKGQIIAALCRA